MSKKWYNYFVSVEGSASGEGSPPSESAESNASPGESSAVPSAAQTVAEIAATIREPKFTPPAGSQSGAPASFDEIYQAAEIASPPHGYTILKVAEMLQSTHIKSLPAEVKKSSVMVALDAAGVKIQEVIQDAVRRDKALDTFERVQQKAVDDTETRLTEENRRIQAEIDQMVAERKAQIKANNDDLTRRKEAFAAWRLKKQQEEQKLADTVSYFVSENPITAPSTAAATSKTPASSKP